MKTFCKNLKNHYNFLIIYEFSQGISILDNDSQSEPKCKFWVEDGPSYIQKSIFWKFTV